MGIQDVVDVVRAVVSLERAALIGQGGMGWGVVGVDVVSPLSVVPRPPLVGFVEGALSIANVSVPTRGRTRVPVFVREGGRMGSGEVLVIAGSCCCCLCCWC